MEKSMNRIKFDVDTGEYLFRRGMNDSRYLPLPAEQIEHELLAEGWLRPSIREEFSAARRGDFQSWLQSRTMNEKHLINAFVDHICDGLEKTKKLPRPHDARQPR